MKRSVDTKIAEWIHRYEQFKKSFIQEQHAFMPMWKRNKKWYTRLGMEIETNSYLMKTIKKIKEITIKELNG